MLNNLKGELVRKGYVVPSKAIVAVLNCNEKTARNKLNSLVPFKLSEVILIMNTLFKQDGFTVQYLFEEQEHAS